MPIKTKKTNNNRRYPKMGGHPARRTAEKRLTAAELVAGRRTPAQQLAHLDALFGEGQGARKERACLAVKFAKSEYGEF